MKNVVVYSVRFIWQKDGNVNFTIQSGTLEVLRDFAKRLCSDLPADVKVGAEYLHSYVCSEIGKIYDCRAEIEKQDFDDDNTLKEEN